ncbi:MAG TPA: hypothetical protein VJB13_04390 [Candidatus Nanoarchaeia archaeon]|nr:hypothetical protein [Candidatus Nanoarchaeia archaeon]
MASTTFKAGLTGLVAAMGLLGCEQEESRRLESMDIPTVGVVKAPLDPRDLEKPDLHKKRCPNPPHWKSNAEIGKVVKETVEKYFQQDVKDMYQKLGVPARAAPPIRYKIGKKPDPKWYHKDVKYNIETDDITVILTYENSFTKHADDFNRFCINTKRLIKYNRRDLRQEAAFDYFFDLTKQLGVRSWTINSLKLENYKADDFLDKMVLYNLIPDGVVGYMMVYGDKTGEEQERLQDFLRNNHFSEEEALKNVSPITFELAAWYLITPILHKNFQQGVKELIKNPLTEKDLEDLTPYRKKIMDKIERE